MRCFGSRAQILLLVFQILPEYGIFLRNPARLLCARKSSSLKQLPFPILPAAQLGEKTACFTNVDRTMHVSLKSVDPPGEARSDMDIFLDFPKRMDFKTISPDPRSPFLAQIS